jgi:hypothetical protein
MTTVDVVRSTAVSENYTAGVRPYASDYYTPDYVPLISTCSAFRIQ